MTFRIPHSAIRILALAALVTVRGAPCVAQGTLVIRGATIHTLAGPDIPNGTVVVTDGRITAVGPTAAAPAGAKVIEGAGLHVYPGIFDAETELGLVEIDAIPVTVDFSELGEFNPQLIAATAVHPAGEHIPVTRANGVTHVISAPRARAGGIGGQASLINLDGWTIDEMMVKPSVGFIFNWPTIQVGGGGFGGGGGGFGGGSARNYTDARKEHDEHVRRLEGWLEDARRYDAAVKGGQIVPRDLKLEALSKLTRKELPLLVRTDQARYIKEAIEFAGKHDIKIVIMHGNEAYKVRTELAQKNIPVILGPTQALPSGPDEGYDEANGAAGLLVKAGVKVAMASFNSADSRTLPYEVGNAVSYGLPRDEAFKAISLRPAEIYGVADRFGTVEVGKMGNLIVTTGDPLEYQTQFKNVIIAGRDVGLANKHLELYEKYRSRPKR